MSQITIKHGYAEITLESAGSTRQAGSRGTTADYLPRDLMDATAAALLAVNTPQSVGWAHEIFRMTAGTQA